MNEHAGVLDRRVEALLIDSLLVAVAVTALGYVAGTLLVGGEFGGLGGAYLAVAFGTPVTLVGYQIAFEGYYGQTIGKYARGIVVVKSDGARISWGAALARNLLRFVDVLPAFYLVGIVVAYATDEHQRLGDLAGDTVVVRTRASSDAPASAVAQSAEERATK